MFEMQPDEKHEADHHSVASMVKTMKKVRANFSRETRFHPDEESIFLLTERSEPVRDGRVEL
jgi:hypothetical protein